MEKSTAPRARFIAAILLFAAVVIGDLILSRGYLAQGPATWPVFLLLELVMLALLVIGGILFCNRRGWTATKSSFWGLGFSWCGASLPSFSLPTIRRCTFPPCTPNIPATGRPSPA